MGTRRLPAGRKAEIAQFVVSHGEVTVAQLSQEFGVSVDTVRRDLDTLASMGAVVRTHGGAMSAQESPATASVAEDVRLDLRLKQREDAKMKIGAAAAALVQSGDAVLVGSGTTALAVAANLHVADDLIVVTNNLLAPGVLQAEAVREVHVIGGEVRLDGQVTVAPVVLNGAAGPNSTFQCDVSFIGVGAVSVEGGFTTSHVAEGQMMRQMMELSRKVVVLADASKFGQTLFAQVSDFENVDVLVTDSEPEEKLAKALKTAGVQVIIAK